MSINTNQQVRSIFAPPSQPVRFGDLLSTYQGPGKERFLDAAERLKLVSADQRTAGVTEAADGLVRSGPTAAFIDDGVQAAAHTTTVVDNPVYGGAWAAMMRDSGVPMPHYGREGSLPIATAAKTPVPRLGVFEGPLGDAVQSAVKASSAESVGASVTDDVVKGGLRGVMSFDEGIDDTLRLLAKFRVR